MKNKHLVLLFAAVLGVAWVARRIPWKYRHDVALRLSTLRPDQIASLEFSFGDGAVMSLDQIQGEWTAAIDRTPRALKLNAAQTDTLFALLCEESKARIVRTKRPDTLRMEQVQSLTIRIKSRSGREERAWVGGARWGSAYARVGALPDYFAIGDGLTHFVGQLRQNAYAPEPAFVWPKGNLRSVYLDTGAGEALFLTPNEADGVWSNTDDTLKIDATQMAHWLALLQGLSLAPRSALFDDSDAESDRVGAIKLSFAGGAAPLEFAFYLQEGHGPSGYFFKTSTKPLIYYAITDASVAATLLGLGRE